VNYARRQRYRRLSHASAGPCRGGMAHDLSAQLVDRSRRREGLQAQTLVCHCENDFYPAASGARPLTVRDMTTGVRRGGRHRLDEVVRLCGRRRYLDAGAHCATRPTSGLATPSLRYEKLMNGSRSRAPATWKSR
jgi:hypothetical protein